MRGDDQRAIACQPEKPLDDGLGGARVQVRGGLVHEQQSRVGVDRGARQRQAHQLAAGQPDAALAERAFGQGLCDPVQRGQGQRIADLLAPHAGPVQRDIALDRAREDVRALADPGHACAQPPGVGLVDRHAVDADLAARCRQQARDQRQQRGLARAAGPHEGDPLAGADPQREAVQEQRLAGVAEAELVDVDVDRGVAEGRGRGLAPAGCGGRRERLGRGLAGVERARQRHAGVAMSLEPRQRRFAGGAVVPDGGELAQRLEEGRREHQDEESFAQREALSPGADAAQRAQQVEADVDRDQRHAQRREQLERGRGQEGDPQHAHGALAQRFGTVAQPSRGQCHRAVRADRRQAAQPIEQEGVHPAEFDEMRLAGGLRAPADEGHEQRDQRHRADQDQRRGPGLAAHGQRDQRRHQHRAVPRPAMPAQPGHERLGLLGEQRGDLARRGAVAVQRGAAGEGGDGLGAQGRQRLSRAAMHLTGAPDVQRAAQHAQREQSERRTGDVPQAAAVGQALHGQRDQGGLRDPEQGGERLRERSGPQAGQPGESRADRAVRGVCAGWAAVAVAGCH